MEPVNWVPGRITLNCKHARCWVLTFFWCAIFILIPFCILLCILESGNLEISFPRISSSRGPFQILSNQQKECLYQSPKSCEAFPRKYLHLCCRRLRSLISVQGVLTLPDFHMQRRSCFSYGYPSPSDDDGFMRTDFS